MILFPTIDHCSGLLRLRLLLSSIFNRLGGSMFSFVLSAATCIPVLWWIVVYSQRLILGSLCPLHLQIEIEREWGGEGEGGSKYNTRTIRVGSPAIYHKTIVPIVVVAVHSFNRYHQRKSFNRVSHSLPHLFSGGGRRSGFYVVEATTLTFKAHPLIRLKRDQAVYCSDRETL